MAIFNSHAAISHAHLTSIELSTSVTVALRACSLVILLMLSLLLTSALLATPSPFAAAGQSWTGITQTNPAVLR